jgi:exodeoxyribonuclease (lambda-induced)
MKIHQCEQGSLDWLNLRAGVVTASEADALVSPTGKVRDSAGVTTYLHRKLTEKWTDSPLPQLQGIFDMEQGAILEFQAKPAFTVNTGLEIQNVGFISSDDGRIGCSPDALIGNASGCEIKCPTLPVHLGYLLSGGVPKEYFCQVQFSMMVTGFETWHFYSHSRQIAPLHLVIERDDAFQSALRDAVDGFLYKLDACWDRLCALNGGPPRRKPLPDSRLREETFDVIP